MADIERVEIIDRVVDQWRRRKWLFIVSFLSVFTLALFLVMALPPLYRASTTMLFTQDEVAESLLETTATNELELRLAAIRRHEPHPFAGSNRGAGPL